MAGQSEGHWIHCENPWEANSKSKESVVSYVLSICDKLDTMRSLVTENVQDAQRTQKAWYDRNVCQRQLSIGDQVLVLLPTDSSTMAGFLSYHSEDWSSCLLCQYVRPSQA